MPNWRVLISEIGLESLLRREHRNYAPAVSGALSEFLNGLPSERQTAILADQLSLPVDSTPSWRLTVLARGSPVLHKIGQTLARDRRLVAGFRECLQELESLTPSVPLTIIQETIEKELGHLDRSGIVLVPPALAEASVAVVVPFRWRQAGKCSQDGVFKVLKPGIEERLTEDLEQLSRVGAYLDETCEEFEIPPLEYRNLFEQVRDKLQHEVRLDSEQHNLALARKLYEEDRGVLIPDLFEFCSTRVTAMERVNGCRVTLANGETRGGKGRIADLIIRALIGRPVFSTDEETLFHADPHAGNLFLTEDHRLAILDWSLAGFLRGRDRVALVQMLLGALTMNAERITGALKDLTEGRSDLGMSGNIIRDSMRRAWQHRLPGFTWLRDLLDELARSSGLQLRADLKFFRKALHSIEGVAADVRGGHAEIDRVLVDEFLCRFAQRWPNRLMGQPDRLDFISRLSLEDIAGIGLSFPFIMTRLWLDRVRDHLLPSGIFRPRCWDFREI